MPDLLLELFSEEIPARMQQKAAGDLKTRVTGALVAAGLTYEAAQHYWTPRRLTLDLRGVTARSADIHNERKGPRVDAPDKAVEGFLRAAGLSSRDEAEVRSDAKKGDYYVAVISKPGRAAETIIAEVMPQIIRTFSWPKSMRWGAASSEPGSLRWVRPLQSIVCTFGPETEEPVVVDFEIGDVRASNITYGHRFHAPQAIKVRRFDDYVAALQKARVVLDAERRQHIIHEDAKNLAFAQGLELVDDAGLVAETANLVEWPVVLIGEFDAGFLDIPDEVARLTIRTNQKCFVLRDKDGALTNRFLLVSNIEASDGGDEVIRGNGKVVDARLSDAKFFWDTDLMLVRNQGFQPWISKLDNVTFHAKLGTQGEQVRRIAALAGKFAPVAGADADLAERAASIAKADLASAMVNEFPEVQGLMGRYYAQYAGEDAAVAAAIEEHYKPQGPSDTVPDDAVSVAVALADKLDTLIGFWAIDEKPTGSKDPYALRRAALGVIRLVLENGIRLRILPAFGQGYEILANQLAGDGVTLDGDHGEKCGQDLLAFFHDRLKVHLRDEGIRHDLIDAVLAAEADDLTAIASRAAALQKLIDTDDGANLLAGAKRATNILAAEEKKGTKVALSVEPSLFESDDEHALLDSLEEAEMFARRAIEAEDYEKAMGFLAQLRAPVDNFFEHVMVNTDDEAVRANRLALMRRIRSATETVADFSKISG